MAKKEIIKSLVREVSGKSDKIEDETNLFMSGYLDSFSIVNLIMIFEEKFNITFDFQDVHENNFKNIDAIINLLENKYSVNIIQ